MTKFRIQRFAIFGGLIAWGHINLRFVEFQIFPEAIFARESRELVQIGRQAPTYFSLITDYFSLRRSQRRYLPGIISSR